MLIIHKCYCNKISPEIKNIRFDVGFVIYTMAFTGHRNFETLKVKIKKCQHPFFEKVARSLNENVCFQDLTGNAHGIT